MVSLLFHESVAKWRMSVNNKDIIGMHLLAYYPKDTLYQLLYYIDPITAHIKGTILG